MDMLTVQGLVRTAVLAFALYQSIRIVIRLSVIVVMLGNKDHSPVVAGADKNGNFVISHYLTISTALSWAVIINQWTN